LDASINSQGYKKWSTNPATANYNNYTFMAEYNSTGPGYNLTGRIAGNVTIVLSPNQARAYGTPKDVFMTPDGSQPDISWIDANAYTW
jgi:Uma2 family endonuclease